MDLGRITGEVAFPRPSRRALAAAPASLGAEAAGFAVAGVDFADAGFTKDLGATPAGTLPVLFPPWPDPAMPFCWEACREDALAEEASAPHS